eukprot:RCo019879
MELGLSNGELAAATSAAGERGGEVAEGYSTARARRVVPTVGDFALGEDTDTGESSSAGGCGGSGISGVGCGTGGFRQCWGPADPELAAWLDLVGYREGGGPSGLSAGKWTVRDSPKLTEPDLVFAPSAGFLECNAMVASR